MKKLALLGVLIFLVGCSSNYVVQPIETPNKSLGGDSEVYVMLPKDGQYGTTVYFGSGQMTVQAIHAALVSKVKKVYIANVSEDLEDALKNAKEMQFTYVFQPMILHWEDRATEWSGRPDQITLKYTVFDVATTEPVASTTISGTSKWATFGGDHPQDLVPVPTQTFVNQVF